jgi:hypothetical protein
MFVVANFLDHFKLIYFTSDIQIDRYIFEQIVTDLQIGPVLIKSAHKDTM